jgi:DNA polymerase-3 subunit epsilon
MFVVLDTETTGLYPYRGHEMISFAGIKLNKDLEEIERLHLHIWPKNIGNADPKSLKINGYTQDQWAMCNAVSPQRAAMIIADFMGDCIPVAHNWPFDRGFILKMLNESVPQRKILRRGIDTIALASAALMPHGYRSMSMSSICKIFGWPEQTHDALDDTLMCVQLFRLLYPMGARSAIKVRMMLYRAKIRVYLNPLRGK